VLTAVLEGGMNNVGESGPFTGPLAGGTQTWAGRFFATAAVAPDDAYNGLHILGE
jgi:hypothetical protein